MSLRIHSICIHLWVWTHNFLYKRSNLLTPTLICNCCDRESVNEVVACLSQHGPTIKPMSFIGQAGAGGKKGLTQREQIEVTTGTSCRFTKL
jgi:ERCC4-related helicase